MTRKIRLKIHERMLRNNKGLLTYKYITALAPTDKISEEDSLSAIAKRLNMPEAKVSYVLEEIMLYIVRKLLEGYAVEIPNFGKFSLGIKATAKGRLIDAGAKAVKSASINYLPTSKIRKLTDVSNLHFKIVDNEICS